MVTQVKLGLLSANQEATADNIALYAAAERGDLSQVMRLVSVGAKPNFFRHPEDQKNSLHIAAEKAHENVIQYLLENGAVANSVSAADQNTAINFAARNPSTSRQTIELLIDYGADPAHANGFGNTSLHEAAFVANLEVAEALIGRGVDVTTVNHKGSTALHLLCYSEKANPQILEHFAELLFLTDSSVLEIADKHGQTPLLVCAATGNRVILRWLLQKNVSLMVKDDSHRNVVDIARFYGHQDIAEMMEKHIHATCGGDARGKK